MAHPEGSGGCGVEVEDGILNRMTVGVGKILSKMFQLPSAQQQELRDVGSDIGHVEWTAQHDRRLGAPLPAQVISDIFRFVHDAYGITLEDARTSKKKDIVQLAQKMFDEMTRLWAEREGDDSDDDTKLINEFLLGIENALRITDACRSGGCITDIYLFRISKVYQRLRSMMIQAYTIYPIHVVLPILGPVEAAGMIENMTGEEINFTMTKMSADQIKSIAEAVATMSLEAIKSTLSKLDETNRHRLLETQNPEIEATMMSLMFQ